MSAVALTSALFTTPSFGADRPEVSAFETAMRSRNVEGAIDAYHALLLGKDAAINIDATADGQAGRLSMALGDPLTASALLERNAQGDQGNPALRGLASAYALLVLGDFDAAETMFARSSLIGTVSERTRAVLGRAQSLATTRPREALAIMATISSTDRSVAWRLPFATAVAQLNLGETIKAREAANVALVSAIDAPLADFAPLTVQQLQVAIAVHAGEAPKTAALLAAIPSGVDRASDVAKSLSSRAPPCGQEGIREDDYATIVYTPPSDFPVASATVVGASRPEIVAVFQRAVAGLWRSGLSVSVAGWPIVTLRCRNAEPLGYGTDQEFKSYAALMASNQVRPLFIGPRYNKQADPLSAAASFVDKYEARVGSQSPLLVSALAELAGMTMARVQEQGDVPIGSVTILLERADVLTKKLKDESGRVIGALFLSRNASGLPAIDIIKAWLSTAPLEYAYSVAAHVTEQPEIPSDDRLAVLDLILPRLGPLKTDFRRQMIEGRRVRLMREMGVRDLDKVVLKAGLNPQLCNHRAKGPTLADSGISDSDYPDEAIIAEVQGITVTELDISARGTAIARIIADAPSLMFSKAFQQKVSGLRYEPTRDGANRVVACRAFPQTIRWQMPEGGPTPVQVAPGPTS